MSLVDEIEALKANKDLSPEERKKQIKRLRRKARRSGEIETPKAIKKAEADNTKKLTLEELVAATREFLIRMGAKEVEPKTLGYAFSLRQAVNYSVTEPAAFVNKFRARWGSDPTTFFILEKPADTMLFLGPIRGQGD